MLVEGSFQFFRDEFLAFKWLDHNANWQFILAAEFQIALVVRWYGHDRARAVLHQHKIPHPNRNLFPAKGIERVAAGEESFLFHRRQIFGLYRGLKYLCQLWLGLRTHWRTFQQLTDQRMRWRKNQRGGAVNRVDARRENLDRLRECGFPRCRSCT